MRTRTILAVAVLAGLTIIPRCATRSGYGYAALDMTDAVAKTEPAPAAPVLPVAAPADPFRETIRPILSARCGECHDPGGRMYARLPFDDREVVSSHGAAILRRLKGDDRAAMEKWLAGLAAASEPR